MARFGKSDEDQLMVAIDSFVGDGGLAIKAGARLLASDPIVKRVPIMFVPFSAGDRAVWERRNQLSDDRSQRELETRLRDTAPRAGITLQAMEIPLERQVVCIKHAGQLGAKVEGLMTVGEPLGIRAGEIASKTWKLVRAHPECFVDVLPAGLSAIDAVVALEDISSHAADGSVARIYRHQWIRYDNPAVAIHPSLFERAPRPFARAEA